MSVDYFLYAKKQKESILSHLKEIKEIYNELIEVTNSQDQTVYDKDKDVELFENLRNMYIKNIEETQNMYNLLTDIGCELCQHNFVQDTIDIDPDRSKVITYCTICEYTKE